MRIVPKAPIETLPERRRRRDSQCSRYWQPTPRGRPPALNPAPRIRGTAARTGLVEPVLFDATNFPVDRACPRDSALWSWTG